MPKSPKGWPRLSNTALESKVDTTLKVLVTLLAQPRTSAAQLAEGLGQAPNTVAKHIGRLRDAGLSIGYNFEDEQYTIDLGEALHTSLLGRYAKTMQTIIGSSEKPEPVKFVHALDRYTLPEFAESIGCTAQNVYNMIIGYKGATLRSGYVAYQVKERGKWLVQRMVRDELNQRWLVPQNVVDAYRIVIGEGADVTTREQQEQRSQCNEDDCDNRIIAKGRCWKHYARMRRAAPAMLASQPALL